MSSTPEFGGFAPAPAPGAAPEPLSTPIVTPSPLPTAGSYELSGHGKPVAAVEIIGHPVSKPVAKEMDSLHLAEIITYRDGTHDIVGYFPEGTSSFAHNGDPLYPATKLDGETKAQYIASGREHYSLKIEPTEHKSLDQFVAAQERSWSLARAAKHPPEYDFAGNDLHNSNGAMVASVADAGRADVAARLMRDLEPPKRIAEIEQRHGLPPEAAAMRMAIDRRFSGEPSAPGASHALTKAQVQGVATPEAATAAKQLQRNEGFGAFLAMASMGEDALGGTGRKRDLLDVGPSRDGQYFTVMRTDASGHQSLQRMHEPFQMQGSLVAADSERVTQNIGRGETFTYKTDDLLHATREPHEALRTLEDAAKHHELTDINWGQTA